MVIAIVHLVAVLASSGSIATVVERLDFVVSDEVLQPSISVASVFVRGRKSGLTIH